MPSNFQDLVSISGNAGSSTLVYRGLALQIGTTSWSTVSIGLSNSAGLLAVAAAPTGNGTVFLPTSGGTLLSNINVSAGTTSGNVSAVTLSNANNVSFGFDGSNITATATVATSLTNVNVSAGTTSNNLSAVVFSNSNGVSFGLNGSTVTGSVATSLTNINLSAGTTSNNLSAAVFSNSNNVSFGLSGSTVTASAGGGAGGIASLSSYEPFRHGGLSATFGLPGALAFSASFNPFVIDFNLTATNILFMYSQTFTGAQTFTVSAGLYTVATATGGMSNWTLSSASSSTSSFSSNANASNNEIFYKQFTINSWALTPGLYVMGMNFSWDNTSKAPPAIFCGPSGNGNVTVGSALSAFLQSFILPGYSSANAALPSSVGVSNTAAYIRTGASVLQQPWFVLLGT